MAPICALGSNHEELFQNLCDKKRVIERIDKNTPARKKIRASWYVPYPNLEDDLFREKLAQVKTRGSTSAYAATKASLLALQDAGLEQADEDAVVFIGNDSFSMGEFTNEILRFEQEQKMNIMVVPMTMQSSIDSWVTIALGTHGMSSVLNMHVLPPQQQSAGATTIFRTVLAAWQSVAEPPIFPIKISP